MTKAVPPNLVGLCYNCLGDDHVKADCVFRSRCTNCRSECHRAKDCPFPPMTMARSGKRARSPARVAQGRRAAPRRVSMTQRRPVDTSDTASARSASTGRLPFVPRCCAPPTPQPANPDSPHPVVEPSRPTDAVPEPERVAITAQLPRRFLELVVVPRSPEHEAAEADLRLALVAVVVGTRPLVSPAMVRTFLATHYGLDETSTTVHRHDPEDFIVRFSRREDLELVLGSRVHDALFSLIWRPWR